MACRAIILSAFLILESLFHFSFCQAISTVSCHEGERKALLKFKQSLIDPSNRLGLWLDGTNCCDWKGVVCHNFTGHIRQLRLGKNPCYADPTNRTEYAKFQASSLGGNVSDSLLYLKHLHYLDLSCNDFGGIQVPKFLGSMDSLRYLNLSGAGFSGLVPHQLGNLSNLRHLDLGFEYSYSLYTENLQWLSGLSLLEHLDMSLVDLRNAYDWLQVTNSLPSLKQLHLLGCELHHLPLLSYVNFSSLQILDLSQNYANNSLIPTWVFSIDSLVSLTLSFNNFQGPIPRGFQNMTSLRFLDLSGNPFYSPLPDWLFSFSHLEKLELRDNNLNGTIPEAIGNLTSLVYLDISYNDFQGQVPRTLGTLCNLQVVDLSHNKLDQDISQVLKSMTGCLSDRLEVFSCDSCQLSGTLTNNLGQFNNLRSITLPNNSISGTIPASIGLLKSLRKLDLSINQLNGTLPESLGQLIELEMLLIGHNSLDGNVSENFFANLTKLSRFDASRNSMTLMVNPDWIPPFQLSILSLSSWDLRSEFPQWIRSQKYLYYLDIANAGIRDTIPTWFWEMSSQLNHLNLSHNYFRGEVPEVIPDNSSLNIGEVDLSSNYLEGPLPHVSSFVTVLDLSNNLFSGTLPHFLCYKRNESTMMAILRLGQNQLSGEIPDCWMNWQNLVSVELQNNYLSGTLPSSIGFLSRLQSLHLRRNNLSGVLPSSLQNCTQLLSLDIGENKFVGRIPSWIGENLTDAMIVILRSNNFHGPIPDELCALERLQILDLAYNKLSGKIPNCFINFRAMTKRGNSVIPIQYSPHGSFAGLEILENAILVSKGIQLEYSRTLRLVMIMDLSSNNLSGDIPAKITNLLAIYSLNLSHNLLTGKIPENRGSMGSLESLDLSFNQLSGEIPPSIAKMTFLSVLNLSYNNLTGKIPTSTQLQSFNASSFVGNNLCGPPRSDSCNTDDASPNAASGEGETHGVHVDGFYVSLTVGFVVAFWGITGPLIYSRSWRFAYYKWLDRIWYKLVDAVACRC